MQENQWPRNPVLTFWQSKRICSDNAAIINGKNPPQLTAKKLMRLAPQIPIDWTEQRNLLGFAKR
jgi:hypothetical protein